MSVIDTQSDAVVATLWAKPKPSDLLGASPNAVVFAASGKRFYTANGSQNAIAVFDFDAAEPGESKLRGMIPVGWYPGALAIDASGTTIFAANIKGLPKVPRETDDGEANDDARGFNSHQYSGSLSIVPLPPDAELPRSRKEWPLNLRHPKIADALLPPREDQPPRPVPERIGEPSVIRHVVYIIKENRTYDQVFGDIEARQWQCRRCASSAQTTRRTTTSWPASSCSSTTPIAAASSVPTAINGARPPSAPTTWRKASPASRAATRTAWAKTRTTPSPIRPPASSGTTP